MSRPQRFKLTVRVNVQEIDQYGSPVGYGGNGLSVEHTLDLGPLDFMGLAGVLGQFHDLSEKIKDSQPPPATHDVNGKPL